MKPTPIVVAAALLTGLSTAASAAEYKCARAELSRVDAIACAKAAKDLNELRQFVWNTRMVYALHFYDYVGPQREARQVALSAPAPEQTSEATARTKD